MKRFRFTFLAICLILTWLGSIDLILLLRNTEPLAIDISELASGPPQQEWLQINGGHLDILKGINMSGTIEIDSFLIPLVADQNEGHPRLWVETRNPDIIKLLTNYYFKLDDDKQRAAYLADNQDAFFPQITITGMTADNLIANANRNKLIELLNSMQIETSEDVLFISEGKEPGRYRGPLFLLLAMIGVLKFIFWNRKSGEEV